MKRPQSILDVKTLLNHKPIAKQQISKMLMLELLPRYKKFIRENSDDEKYLYSSNNYDPTIIDPLTDPITDTSLNNYPFNYRFFSFNHNISLEYLSKYLDKEWNWSYITFSIFQTNDYDEVEAFILNHPEVPWDINTLAFAIKTPAILNMYSPELWDWRSLSMNSSLMTIPIMLEHLNHIEMNFICSCINSQTIHDLLSIQEKEEKSPIERELLNRINWNSLSLNDNLSLEHIQNYPASREKWQLKSILFKKWTSTEMIMSFKNHITLQDKCSLLTTTAKLNYTYLYNSLELENVLKHLIQIHRYSRTFKINPQFTIMFLDKYPNTLIEYPHVYEYIPMKLVLRYYKHINYQYLSKNPQLSYTFILDNIDKCWDWNEISKNWTIDARFYEFIVKNHTRYSDIITNIKWEYLHYQSMRETTIIELQKYGIEISCHYLSRNLHLSSNYINEHPSYFTSSIINSSNISLEFIEKHSEMFQDQPLTSIFNAPVERKIIDNAFRKYMAGFTIHRILRMCMYNPKYAFARRWLIRNF